MATTFFKLPTTPDEFGVVLPSPNLRSLDFSGLDFTTSIRVIIEYLKTYYPDDFNDFIAANGYMALLEIVALTTSKLSLRSDILSGEATLPTARTERAVVNHLSLIGQRIKRQTPAVVDVEISVEQPVYTDIEIDAGTSFAISGPDGSDITYEVYRAPGDWSNPIIIPAGKRGVIAYGLEGRFASPVTVTSVGGPNQQYLVQDDNILESPLFVTVGTEKWRTILEPIERYGPADKVVEAVFIDDKVQFRFGDNLTGQIPTAGTTITFSYRVGGGVRGRIGAGRINTTRQLTPLPPANAATTVRFRNLATSIGGTNIESLESAKRRAPRDFALQRSIVTAGDYAQAASSFSHPVFGSVSKAVAAVRTSRNANLVEIYALAIGADGLPVAPNAGLKAGLVTYFNDLDICTNQVEVLDGAIKAIDIDLTIVINRNADASVIKERAEAALTTFFDIERWELGQPLYLSNLVEVIEAIDGIAYVNVNKPTTNIVATGALADIDSIGVGYNELIVEGQRTVNYYYERNIATPGSR